MKVITDDIIFDFPPCAATIGCFDGVHRGHQFLITQVREAAERRNLSSALITFPVHPRQVMQSDYQPQLLSCYQQKVALLEQQPADYCIMLPFTRELSMLSAYEFMKMLRDRFRVEVLLIGYDHRFGHNRAEGFDDYCRYGQELGMEVIRAQALMENDLSISSSTIRRLLKEGDVEQANHFLGYRYYLDGIVVGGYKVGRKLGFPTANLQPSCADKLVPGEGVYAIYAYVDDRRYIGMLNIGNRPTVDNGNNVSIEAHILDFSEDIYNRHLRIEFMHFIRPEQKFADLDELIAQLNKDKETVRKIFYKE